MALFKLKPIEPIDFQTLVRPSSPNTYLAAPHGFIPAGSDQEAPIFDTTQTAVLSAWDTFVNTLPRLIEIDRRDTPCQRTYVQRTALMGYPDIITVQFIERDAGRATLAIYSRSQYGYSDMGANRRRVTSWLAQLDSIFK